MRRWLLAITVALTGCAADETACETCDVMDEAGLFEQAYEEARDVKDDSTSCSGVRVPDRVGFRKRVALTFTDGPSPETTPRVLEILRRHAAPATFFTTGARYAVPGAKELAAEIAADPLFILASHGQRNINLAQQAASEVAGDLERADALLREAGATPRYFRFPFGAASCEAKQAAEDRGYIVTGWHVDSADWCYAAGGGTCNASMFRYLPEALRGDMRAYVMKQIRASQGGIVLLHDVYGVTVDLLEGLLYTLENEGYELVRLDDTAAWPKLHGTTAPVPTTTFIGDPCAADADCAAIPNGRCHAAKFCTASCAVSCGEQLGKAPTFCVQDLASGVTPTGMCVAKSAPQNASCAGLPGTVARLQASFVGISGATPSTALVCLPREP